jgi:hypothetical protein
VRKFSALALIETLSNPANGFEIETGRLLPVCPIPRRRCPENPAEPCAGCPPQALYFHTIVTDKRKYGCFRLMFTYPVVKGGARTGDGYIPESNPALLTLLSTGYLKPDMLTVI